ncbi:MAG: hypothetical protein JSS53_02555 [Proteobacteria bacterium]|nr:hypothetical protein [Pseudomonadota bacterium]
MNELVSSVDHKTEEESDNLLSFTIIMTAGIPIIFLAALAYALHLYKQMKRRLNQAPSYSQELTHFQQLDRSNNAREFRNLLRSRIPSPFDVFQTVALFLGPGMFAYAGSEQFVRQIRGFTVGSGNVSTVERSITISSNVLIAILYGAGYKEIFGAPLNDRYGGRGENNSQETGMLVFLKNVLRTFLGMDREGHINLRDSQFWKRLWTNYALIFSHILETGYSISCFLDVVGVEEGSLNYYALFCAIAVTIGIPLTIAETMALVDEMLNHQSETAGQRISWGEYFKRYRSLSPFAGFSEIAAPLIIMTKILKWTIFSRTLDFDQPFENYPGPFEVGRYNEWLFSIIILVASSIFLLPNIFSLLDLLRPKEGDASSLRSLAGCLFDWLPCRTRNTNQETETQRQLLTLPQQQNYDSQGTSPELDL